MLYAKIYENELSSKVVLMAIASAFVLFFALPNISKAQPITNQTLVLNCLATIGDETSWPECRGIMFAPCEEYTVGTAVHQSCLLRQKTDWENEMADKQEALVEKLTASGNSMLAELMSNWVTYREARCMEVSAERPEAERSAKLGCEVAEIAGITAEFDACLEGRSTTSYCTLKE